jgi:hypothetical protein
LKGKEFNKPQIIFQGQPELDIKKKNPNLQKGHVQWKKEIKINFTNDRLSMKKSGQNKIYQRETSNEKTSHRARHMWSIISSTTHIKKEEENKQSK